MKIAFLMEKFPVLSQTFVFNQITRLIDDGHDVDIFCENIHDTSLFQQKVDKYHLMERCHLICSPGTFFKKLSGTLELLLGLGPLSVIQSIKILFKKRIGRKHFLDDMFASRVIASRGPHDIFVCHFGQEGLRGQFFKYHEVTKAKILTFFHGLDMSLFLKEHGDNVYRVLFSSGDLFLPISDFWNEKLVYLGAPSDKIITQKMGVDVARFPFSYKALNPLGSYKLVSISRLVEKKGLEYAIKAVSLMLAEGWDVDYEIIGEGIYRKSLEELIDKLGIGSRVRLADSVRHDEVAKRISAADVFLLPSVVAENGDMEGIPVVLMEAMALGVPVLTSQHSGIPELVRDGETGMLVPERDERAICEKLNMLLSDRRLHRDVAYNARRFVEQHHNKVILDKVFAKMIARL